MTDAQTNALIRRTGDQRTRNRRVINSGGLPSLFPDDRRMAEAEKYYCPSCGQVVRVSPPGFRSPRTVGNDVMPHEFDTGESTMVNRQIEYCPGGTFDPEADAA
jgi:hypothetical protein